MIDRTRGQETRQRILEEACKVFGEKGFRDATHAEICREAGANVAAINYYFGTKEALYRAVFEHLSVLAETLYPFTQGVSESASPEDQLHAFVRAFLGRVFDPDQLKHLHRIRMAEMFDPTGLLDEVMDQHLAKDRGHILGILRQLLGTGVPERDLSWCEMSIVGQCLMVAHGPRDDRHKDIFGFSEAGVDLLAEHITDFSLAGVEAIRRKSNSATAWAHHTSGANTTRLEEDDEQFH
ncbi:MAG: CerR family C-terminal domain-containing protein [Candidatus Hydrogenedentales bacterium]